MVSLLGGTSVYDTPTMWFISRKQASGRKHIEDKWLGDMVKRIPPPGRFIGTKVLGEKASGRKHNRPQWSLLPFYECGERA